MEKKDLSLYGYDKYGNLLKYLGRDADGDDYYKDLKTGEVFYLGSYDDDEGQNVIVDYVWDLDTIAEYLI